MANYVSAIKLPNGGIYYVKDREALRLTGGNVTGPVNFGDSVYISDLNVGNLIVTGSANYIDPSSTNIESVNKLNQTVLTTGQSLGNFIDNEGSLIYTAGAEGNIYVDKPSTGNISTDGFGILSFQSGGYYSQILVSSNQNSGIYWRTGSSLSGGWKKLFDDSTIIPVINGGTGVSSFEANSLIMSGSTTTDSLTTKSISTGFSADTSSQTELAKIPTVGVVKSYVDNQANTVKDYVDEQISTMGGTVSDGYVTLTTSQTISGSKTFQNLAEASFKSSSGTEACNVSYNQSLGSLVFSFTN